MAREARLKQRHPCGRRLRLPSAGPAFLTLLLVITGASLAVEYVRWNYTTLVRPEGDAAHTVFFKADDSLWIRSRPDLDQFYPGISTWPHTFTDLFEVWLHAFDGNPYTAWILSPSVYPPLVHLAVWPFSNVSWAWFLGVYVAVAIFGWFFLLRRMLARGGLPHATLGAVALVLFALPVPVGVDRGNIEVLVAMLVAYSVLPAVAGGRSTTQRAWPIVVAGFLKITPFALLGVIKWRRTSLVQGIITGAVCSLASVIGLMVYDGSAVDSARAFADLARGFGSGGVGADPFAFRSTIWGTQSAYVTALGIGQHPAVPSGVVTLGLIGLVAFLAAVLPLHLWERLALIGAAMVLLSADGPAYRLIYLLIAGAVFLAYAWRRRGPYLLTMAVLLASALAMKPWIRELPWAWTLLSGTALSLILLSVVVVGAQRTFRLRRTVSPGSGHGRHALLARGAAK